jgi:hypothetical protein
MGLIAVMLLLAACGGNGGAGEVSLEEYFNRLEVLSDDVRSRANGLSEPASPEDVAGVFSQSIDIFHDFLSEVRDLNPPRAAQRQHDALVHALEDFIDANEDLFGELEDASTEADFQVIFESAPTVAEQAVYSRACADLKQVATDNNLRVNLDCGAGDA